MAAVVSHAMRRFPSTPPDVYSSYELRGESSHQAWSSVEGSESALARSMRYANPWLYGSVRAPAGVLLTPAFVLCACPDYLNGTKRSSKKPQVICKKCKGTRLSVTEGAKFGTVRCYPTANALAVAPLKAGTVRVSSSSRPSILPTADPYDFMRRTRLAVQENGSSQYRARSTSPSKARALEARNHSATRSKSGSSTPEKLISVVSPGRRSILECNINPYELLSSDGIADKESTVKSLNGQRIRIKPLPIDHDYEDVSNAPHKVQTSYESESPKYSKFKDPENRFKSILKKPSTSFSDTDDTDRSPSPALKSGSQFYLPLPRKKVQFLVENKLVQREQVDRTEISSNPNYDVVKQKKESSDESSGSSSEDDTRRKLCSLRRSTSERFIQEPNKVVFQDTMALRTRTPRSDSRTAFTEKDLERLDGINARKRQSNSPTKSRPRKPPPPPPLQNGIDSNAGVAKKEPIAKELKSEKAIELEKPIAIQNNKKIEINISPPFINIQEELPDLVTTSVEEDSIRIVTDAVVEAPPLVPPRKRSNNKSPVQTIQPAPVVQTIKAEPPVVEQIPLKTIVKINPSDSVHKIQIKNEFIDTLNTPSVSVLSTTQRKTSILINGDDCYCTVNVSDDVPLYQSSVVVNDTACKSSVPVIQNKSSSVYITGNFAPISESISSSNSFVAIEQETKEIPTGNEPRTEQVQVGNITEVQLDTKEKKTTTDVPKTDCPIDSKSHKVTISSSEQHAQSEQSLDQILNNPVEAVRRNLVPHVCGKSDVTRMGTNQENPEAEPHRLEKSLIEASDVKLFEDCLWNKSTMLHQDDDGCSEHSSSTQYEMVDPGSDCYTDNSNRSSVTEEELGNRTKFYELLADAALAEVAENEDHHYESIKINPDPIYEEIEIPPPLPANPPPTNLLDDLQLDKEFTTRSIFEGASKYDILSYLVDAKERGIVPEDSYTFSFTNSNGSLDDSKDISEPYNRVSHMSTVSDSSEDSSLIMANLLLEDKTNFQKNAEVERNDSGVGSETSKSSLSKYRNKQETSVTCEDCEIVLESQSENEPLICRKCKKKRSERKEIITEIVETEEKYSRDLQIILEEFYQPMLVAGLLTPEQLSAIFLNVEELLENSQALAERLRDAVEIAAEQGDEDLLTVNIGKLFLEAAPMLHAFETYCIRQGAASLLLASLEKDKELLRIFLRVSQMENTLLRRMNLNSFLMVPVQRVTKYPLLLARLYKVTPVHHETREQLKEAQNKIELHLSHMNSETKDVPSKLWRRISNNSGRRSSAEMDLVNIKLRKIAVDVLEWNHDEAKFTLEGRLLFTQPTDNNWRKGRTIKLAPINALLVTNGKTSSNRTDRTDENGLVFSKHSGVREAALLLVRDKNGRYSLLREPLYLDRCIIAADPAWQSYFEVQELLGKDTFIFKAEDDELTRTWYRQLQYHAQGLGTWRKRRNALANIMINGMGLRS